MSTRHDTTIPEGLKSKFIDLCKSSHVYDREKKWVYLDRLWGEVDTRDKYVEVLEGYLSFLLKGYSANRIVLMTTETISYSYGAAPVVFIVANNLKYPVAIWQEIGDFFNKKPLLIGTNHRNLDCVVVQDVIRTGTTILKLIDWIQGRKWNLVKYIGLVLNCPDPQKLKFTEEEYKRITGAPLPLDFLISVETLR